MSEYIIELENVSYKYPGSSEYAIKNINLRIKKGERVLITGPSGAGKTTLCSIFNGLVPHHYGGELEGRAIVSGRDITEATIGELAFIAGLLFQDPSSQLISPTVEDEVAFGLENKGVSPEEIEKLVDYYLRYLGIEHLKGRTPQHLSGGQQQLVALAAVLAMEPEIYVLDEPTSNLDPINSEMVFKVIHRIAKERAKTLILVEHKLEKVIDIVDRLIVMNKGEIVYNGPFEGILDDINKYEEIINLGVPIPQVTQLYALFKKSNKINSSKIPLKVPEARDVFARYIDLQNQERIKDACLKYTFQDKYTQNRKEPIIKVEDVHFVYPNGVKALNGISLEIYRGEFVSILGQNGSGKTTLVKHFNGLLKPTSGRVIVDGMDTKEVKMIQLVKKVAYCFQNPDEQIFASRVRDELAYGPKNLGYPPEKIEELVTKVSKELGLYELLDKNPFELSMGQRQILAVASVLVMEPEILIVDEPTTGQDPKGARKIMDLMKSLNQQGKTIIVITHDMNLAAEYSDRIIVINNGKKLTEGTPREVFSNLNLLKKAHLEPPQVTQLALELGLPCIPLNVQECFEIFSQLWREKDE
ncbi:ABC transporter [Thermococcus litoralis DSM 5473]|uniref:ABC transporter n=1 Tax=Thermococcus litoralis (strain ATCC 51850 / DSM 5473 / JCM 8560 / NS-C) TaxID=523849 RepID=H3ZPE3_THELN|nr:energy-coupling factor transporter ATPase [Thermococcus litoralis]EHR78178.1 ABC transporter [Thermococcus litoralis DSM 5473]